MMANHDHSDETAVSSNLKLWKAAVLFLVFALALYIFSSSIANIDLWGHLKAGLDNLANRTIAQLDPYSYLTEGQRWINHEWLSQIIFALAWTIGQVAGLVTTKVISGLLVLGIIYWNFNLQKIDTLAGAFILFLGSILLASDFSTIYPQIFTLVMYSALFFVILRANGGFPKWLWAAPFLFIFWSNLHGGFLIGLAMFTAWVVMVLLQQSLDWRKVLLPLGVSILITLINPYGLALYSYILRSFSDARPEIWVWNPITILSPFGILYLFLFVLSVIGFSFSRRKRSAALIVLFGVAALLPLIARRNLSLFTITALMIAGEHIADILIRPKWMQRQSHWAPAWLSGLFILIGIGAFILAIPNLRTIVLSQSPPYPVRAVQIIKQSGVQGNLATEYNWGGYAIWHLTPAIKVSIDGRRETVYPLEIYRKNLNFLLGLGKWDELLQDHPTELVLVNDHTPVFNLMRYQTGWTLVDLDEAGALYVRAGSPLEAPLLSAAANLTSTDEEPFFP